jgi:hypothetical protein
MRAFSLVRCVAVGSLASALAAVPLGVVSTASAATSTILRLTLPTAISYGDRRTTIAGTLVTGSQGLGGKPVALTLYASDRTTVLADLGTVTTAADGTFSLSTAVPGPGMLRATFAGDDTYARGIAQTWVNVTSRLPSRIQLDPLPTTVDPNTDFTVSGQVQEQAPDGSWEPANWAEVYLLYPGDKSQYVGPDGRFSFTAQESVPTNWTVSAQPDGSSFAAASTTPAQFVNVPPEPTRITSLTVRSNGVAQKGLTLTAHADILAAGQWKPYTGKLDFFFQPKGSTGWQGMYADPNYRSFNANGDQVYSYVIGPYLRIPSASGKDLDSLVSQDGSWRADTEQVTAAPGRTGITASSSDVVPTVVQKYGTSVVNKSIVSTGRSHYLHASLWEPIWDLGGSTPGYIGMVPRQPVKLYYRYSGSSTWHYVTTTSTDGNGRLSVKLTGTHRYYRLVYSGSALYAGTTSSQIYFSS